MCVCVCVCVCACACVCMFVSVYWFVCVLMSVLCHMCSSVIVEIDRHFDNMHIEN